ncbi:MAG: L-seryl-tRNA(Sec) selenium transferase [Gemmatimonadaceae bacterium]|nr:L-seryl-tRNA(Sec) selenium transferase [Gemmatimonadaceae bacterium]
MTEPSRRDLPAVGTLLGHPDVRPLLTRAPRSAVTAAIRGVIDDVRRGAVTPPRTEHEWSERVAEALERGERPSLRRVLNGTGVVLHTNLGRAPLSRAAIEAISATAAGASNLEYDLASGSRGSRDVHAVQLLRELTGAEDALVTNNCAAALVLALRTIAAGREAIISRGELIEIGGSFRVPDIMAESGARLREVGTTNRTHLDDYRRAIGGETGVIVKVHRSNFAQQGYVADATLRDLAPVAREAGVPLLHDFGSGLMADLSAFGLGGEPQARDAIRDGADLVVMSGDKLLGGPQVGIVLGRADLVSRCRRHPLARALRVDKLRLAALEATLRPYREPSTVHEAIPVLTMLTAPVASIRARAMTMASELRDAGLPAAVVDSEATVGGGAFPTARIASSAVALAGGADALDDRLRRAPLPLVGRIADGRLLIDLRSLGPDEDALATGAIVTAQR